MTLIPLRLSPGASGHGRGKYTESVMDLATCEDA
jgi:hypothetical protein